MLFFFFLWKGIKKHSKQLKQTTTADVCGATCLSLHLSQTPKPTYCIDKGFDSSGHHIQCLGPRQAAQKKSQECPLVSERSHNYFEKRNSMNPTCLDFRMWHTGLTPSHCINGFTYSETWREYLSVPSLAVAACLIPSRVTRGSLS